MARMRKTSGKRFYAYIRIRGKEKSIPLKTTNEREAKHRLKVINEQEFLLKSRIINEQEFFDKLNNQGISSTRLDAVVDKFIASCNVRIGSSTLDIYKEALQNFTTFFKAETDIRFLPANGYDTFTNYLLTRACINKNNKTHKGYSHTSTNIKLRVIRTLFNWAIKRDILDKAPFVISQLEVPDVGAKFLSDVQFDKLLDAAKSQPHIQDAFKLYLITGLRRNELKGSFLDGQYIVVLANTNKTKQGRYIRLSEEGVALYQSVKERNLSPNYISHRFKHYRDKAGLPEHFRLHSLRHSFAIRHLVKYRDKNSTQMLLGHTSSKMTDGYTKVPFEYYEQHLKTNNLKSICDTVDTPGINNDENG